MEKTSGVYASSRIAWGHQFYNPALFPLSSLCGHDVTSDGRLAFSVSLPFHDFEHVCGPSPRLAHTENSAPLLFSLISFSCHRSVREPCGKFCGYRSQNTWIPRIPIANTDHLSTPAIHFKPLIWASISTAKITQFLFTIKDKEAQFTS